MQIDLTGRVVLVTGASRGIGAAVAEAFAGAGATVAVHYRQERDAADALAARLGHGARTFCADLAEPHAAQRLWDDVAAAYDRVDVLINNAAVAASAPTDGPLDN